MQEVDVSTLAPPVQLTQPVSSEPIIEDSSDDESVGSSPVHQRATKVLSDKMYYRDVNDSKWQKRQVKLYSRSLRIYKSESTNAQHNNKSHRLAEFELLPSTVVDYADGTFQQDDNAAKEFVFVVKHVGIVVLFAAPSEKAMTQWVEIIARRAANSPPRKVNIVVSGITSSDSTAQIVPMLLEANKALSDTEAEKGPNEEFIVPSVDEKTGDKLDLRISLVFSAFPKKLREVYYTDPDVALLCFDAGDENALEAVENEWYPEVERNVDHEAARFLVGAVSNSASAKVDRTEAETMGDWMGCRFYFEFNCESKEVFSTRDIDYEAGELEKTIQDAWMTILRFTIDRMNSRVVYKWDAHRKPVRKRSHGSNRKSKAISTSAVAERMHLVVRKVKDQDISAKVMKAVESGKKALRRVSLSVQKSIKQKRKKKSANYHHSIDDSVVLVDTD